jgi:HAMP domain-containing protein
VGGLWKDLTDNVNFMAANLTTQVRGIAKVVTAVANGNLKRKLILEAKGEIAELADTINGMIDTLAIFADQVTGVAREVGIEGKLGGQANVPGAAGIWRDLTDNVNQLAGNLTAQVRAIAEVSTPSPRATSRGRSPCSRRGGGGAQGQHQPDDPQPPGDHAQEHRSGLAQDQRRQVHPHAAGAARSDGRLEEPALRGGAARAGAPRRLLPRRARGARPTLTGNGANTSFRLLAATPSASARASPTRFRVGEGLIGQCALNASASCSRTSPATTSRSAPAWARRARSTSCSSPCSSRAR